jgi:hypothetical protein
MTDKTIETVERLCISRNGVADICSCDNCGMEFADKYAALAAELKQLRELLKNIVDADLACRDEGGMQPAQWYLECRRKAEEYFADRH